MLKYITLLCFLAGFLSFGNCCARRHHHHKHGKRGIGGDDGFAGNNEFNGGNGENDGRKRTAQAGQPLFSLTFDTFDADNNGQITLQEFLNVQPEAEHLFKLADVNGDSVVTPDEFSREVEQFGGEAVL